MSKKLKIVCISDTHKPRPELKIPECDILIHAGDHTFNGTKEECINAIRWLSNLAHNTARYTVFIGGNHDFWLQSTRDTQIQNYASIFFEESVHYLEDSEVEIDGFKVWGSPYTPTFGKWAFMKERGDELKEHWSKIPEDVDILVTHGPPLRVRDSVDGILPLGCGDLRGRIEELPNLKLHVFGHIHASYGVLNVGGIQCVNASICDEQYQAANKPIVLELERLKNKVIVKEVE